MFMKTKEIVELTWNVVENKRVVRGPRSVSGPRTALAGSPRVGTWNVYENKPDS